MKRSALAALAAALVLLSVPSVVLGTPEPTRRPGPDRPDRTPAPDATARPTEAPSAPLAPVAVAPTRTTLTVGYRDPGILGQAPLIVAREAGHFADAGFDDVQIVEVEDALADLRDGQLDIAVVDAREAAQAAASPEGGVRAVAGFQNYSADGTYGGDVLLATTELVADEPATLIAFLTAYIQALRDLSDPGSAEQTLALIETTDLAVEPEEAAAWPDQAAVYAPFDGGFGAPDDEGGLGELDRWLADGGVEVADPQDLIADHTLTIAQLLLGLEPNPVSDLAGAPGLTSIRVGIPSAENIGALPVAAEAGYLDAAGFEDVAILDVEAPLLGVLNGELDFGIMPAVDLADGVSQGLPIVALAAHANYEPDGSYASDVLVTSIDTLTQEPSTVGALLIAYVRAMQDLEIDPAATAFSPFDGGFGQRDQGGGLDELKAYLTAELGTEPDPETLIARDPLSFAQAWWGLPANPDPVIDSGEVS